MPESQQQHGAPPAEHRYIGIDTTDLDIAGTVARIRAAIPEIYGGRPEPRSDTGGG